MAVSHDQKRDRQRAIREVIAREPIASQQELADRLAERGHSVTQATVSRDVGELGLARVARSGGHVYVAPEDLAAPAEAAGVGGDGASTSAAAAAAAASAARDERLRRILTDIPVSVGRSGLILLLVGQPGTASIVAQAIDESSLRDQEGTLAGDNTVLVLFADEARLERWRARFEALAPTRPPS